MMARRRERHDRRSGRYSRSQSRSRIAGWLRSNWRSLLPAVAFLVLTFALSVAVAPNPFIRGAIVGAGGTLAVGVVFLAALIGSDSMRFVLGTLGEGATEEFFSSRTRRRAGWHLINGIVINGRDIDHIAIGPGGVLAIETKWRSAQQHSRDWAMPARAQTVDAARVASNLIRQEADADLVAVPVLMEWGPGAPPRTNLDHDGIISVTSNDLAPFERWLEEDRLSLQEVDRISGAIDDFLARQLRSNTAR